MKKKIREQREHFNNSLDSVLKDTFEYEISLHQYYDLLYIKQNAYKNRPISNKTFARYLLQSLNVKELNQICRDHKLKGYSALKKQFLIDFIIDNLTEDELKYFLVFNEDRVIEKEIKQAIKVLKHKDTEKFQEAKIINQDNHDIELHFTNLNFDMVS
ncbi:MAG: Rho termination factor N-terminal domain-containing protein [Candidatus Lokiarchaeota archaeon]